METTPTTDAVTILEKRAARRPLDFYETAPWQTRALLNRAPIGGLVLECCSGDDSITNVLRAAGHPVITNDIDPARPADLHLDAAGEELWRAIDRPDWVVSNPPFNRAQEILRLAHAHAKVGVAFLLRLTFMEPTKDRSAWLASTPPAAQIVLPRYSYTGNGRTDSVTTAWFIWPKRSLWWRFAYRQEPIVIVPREERVA